jgi:hypothetical protein
MRLDLSVIPKEMLAARARVGLSQEAVAELMGTTKSAILANAINLRGKFRYLLRRKTTVIGWVPMFDRFFLLPLWCGSTPEGSVLESGIIDNTVPNQTTGGGISVRSKH